MKPILFLLLSLPAIADPSWVQEYRATARPGISCEPAAILASQIAARHGVAGRIVYVRPERGDGHVAFYDSSKPWPWCVSNERVAQVQISCRASCPPDCGSPDHWSWGQAWRLVGSGPWSSGRDPGSQRWGRCRFERVVKVVRTP